MKSLPKSFFTKILFFFFIIYGFSFNAEFKNFSLLILVTFAFDLLFLSNILNKSLEYKKELFKLLHEDGLLFVTKSKTLNLILQSYYLIFVIYFLYLNQYVFSFFFLIYFFVNIEYRKSISSIILPN